MQASILPKRADHEAQKLGFLPLTSVAAFFEQRSAGCGVAGRYSSTSSVIGQLSDIPGPQNVNLSPDNESRDQVSPKIAGSIRVSPGCAGAPSSAPHGNAGTPGPPSSDTPSDIPCNPPSSASDLFSKNCGI